MIENSSEESEVKIVDEFLDFLTWADGRAKPNQEIKSLIEKFYEEIEIEKIRLGNKGQSPLIASLKSKISILKKYLFLNVFGYNSSKYDLQILMTKIMQSLEKNKKIIPGYKSGLKVLKKGTAYFSVQIGNLHFKDLMAFTCPTPLDKYLKTWTKNENKLVSYYR